VADPDLRAAIVQDAEDGRVLMLAWMDDEALRRTRETGEAWFWSRSRRELWHKGETSGNTLAVEEIRDDCDGDAILLRVRPAGPACHTGSRSCFAPWLWRRVAERAKERPRGSYVAKLLDDRAVFLLAQTQFVLALFNIELLKLDLTIVKNCAEHDYVRSALAPTQSIQFRPD